jgi:hypothetical protein
MVWFSQSSLVVSMTGEALENELRELSAVWQEVKMHVPQVFLGLANYLNRECSDAVGGRSTATCDCEQSINRS